MNRSNYDKELRIGLVLYGGVSLAIYIYGVVYEFLRLARGEGLYGRLVEQARVKPVIDVISGSSAGGINGLFLAKALTTGGDLSPLKELWIQKGDLEQLVNADSKKPLSLLDSAYYERQLREALARVRADPATSESKRSLDLLDLFITATNLDGVITEYGAPFFQSPIQTKHYGTVFHFKARPGRYDLSELLEEDAQRALPKDRSVFLQDLLHILKQERQALNDFAVDAGPPAARTGQDKNHYLARVAASTSSFPVAFKPVAFSKPDVAAMKALFGAGVFKQMSSLLGVRHEVLNQAVVYGDGGMVNNKPFSQTLGTIFHRQADVPVDRKLFFIEPDPGAFNERRRLADQAPVDGFHSLFSFFEATFYESISADLETLVEQNQRIQNVRQILTDFEGALAEYLTKYHKSYRTDPAQADRNLYEMQPVYHTYRQLKITALRNELEERLLDKADLNQLVAEAEAEAPPGFAQKEPAEQELYVRERLKAAFADLIRQEYHSLVTDDDTGRFLRRFDYPFRIRRLRYFVGKLNDWLAEIELLPTAAQYPDQIKALRERLGLLKGKFYAFVEFYRHGAWLLWDQAPAITSQAGLARTFDHISHSYDGLMDSRYKNLAFEMVGGDLTQALGQLDQLRPSPPYEDSRYYEIREKTGYLETMLNVCSEQEMQSCLEMVFNTYEFLDMYLYPATMLANIGEADPVEVIRISPKDATRYRTTVEAKLAGEKLMHFSAFLKRSWRENDLLWGRLDAAEIIVRAILPDEEEANRILDELGPAIIKEELISIRDRREVEISQALFTDAQQRRIKAILEEQTTLQQAENVETYLKEYYTVGGEGFENVDQDYLLRTLAKSLRTTSRMVEQRVDRNNQTGGPSPLNRPMQYLSILLNVPYVFLVTLGGAEESQRKRLLNYALVFAVLLLGLQLFGAVEATSWLLLGLIAFLLIYLQPKRLAGFVVLAIALLILLVSAGVIAVSVSSPWF